VKSSAKLLILVVVFAVIILVITNLAGSSRDSSPTLKWTYTDIYSHMSEIKRVSLVQSRQEIDGELDSGEHFIAVGPAPESPVWNELANQLKNENIAVTFAKPPAVQGILGLLSMIALPLMLFALVYFLLLRPAQMSTSSYIRPGIPYSAMKPPQPTKTLLPEGWTRPIGYSNGIVAEGRVVFVAGQIGWDAQQKLVSSDLVAQVRQALSNIVAVLGEAGAGPEKIMRMTWFIVDKQDYLSHREEIGAAYREVIGKHFPAMSLLVVKDLLEDGAKVEIEATAVV